MPSVIIDIPAIEQYEGHFCGAACAQMILLAEDKVANDSHPVQTGLFDDIRNDTRGGFPIVEPCGAKVLRWESFPPALSATLNRRMAGQVDSFSVHHDATPLESTARAVRSINAQQAAVALVENSTHWIVVHGWHDRTSRRRALPSIMIDGQRITHLYVRDPNFAYESEIDIEEWTVAQWKVNCGTFRQQYVVVGRP